jgi:hypothetical protein
MEAVFSVGQLFSMSMNVVTITRENKTSSYGKLNFEEILLVFAQLARCIPDNEVSKIEALLQKTIEDDIGTDSAISAKRNPLKELAMREFKKDYKAVIDPKKATIVLFNEMFFGKTAALEKMEVDRIILCYQKFVPFLSGIYLCINFLYRDSMQVPYEEQVKTSMSRYEEIMKVEMARKPGCGEFVSVTFGSYNSPDNYYTDQKMSSLAFNGKYLSSILEHGKSKEVTVDNGSLLFNQTKILFSGDEIGFFNKSSFSQESLPDFLTWDGKNFVQKLKVPFYMIGDFQIHWLKEENPLFKEISHLICYDTEAMLNFKTLPSKKFCLFISNSYNTLPASIADRRKKHGVFDEYYICADATGVFLDEKQVTFMSNIKNIANITGIFKTTQNALFPLQSIPYTSQLAFSFYQNAYTIYTYNL